MRRGRCSRRIQRTTRHTRSSPVWLCIHSGQYRLVSIDPEPHLRVVEASAPESAEAYYLRALGTKDTRRRIELLDRALDLNPGHQFASLARMNALGDLKDFELELTEADRLIAARPKSARAGA